MKNILYFNAYGANFGDQLTPMIIKKLSKQKDRPDRPDRIIV